MKKRFSLFLILFPVLLFGQNSKPDSLRLAIRRANTLQEKFQANLAAARWFDANDLPNSYPFLTETMHLAGVLADAKSQMYAWMERGYHYQRRGMCDSSNLVYIKALDFARSAGLFSDESTILGNMASNHIFLRNLSEASRLAEDQLSLCLKHGLTRDQGSAYALFAQIADAKGDIPGAIAAFQTAANLFEKHGFPEKLTQITSEIGVEYELLGQYETALLWHQKALALDERSNNEYGMSEVLGNIGNQHDILGRPDSAIFYHTKSLYFARKSGHRRQEAYALNNLGVVLDLQGNKDVALENYELSLKIKQELGDSASFASNYLNIGAIQLGQNRLRKAKDNLEIGLKYAEQFNRLEFQQEAWQNLMLLYEKKGDYKNAIMALRHFYSVRDSLASPADRDSVMALQTRFNDEKEARLRAENETQKLRTEEKSRRANLFGLLSLAAIVLAALTGWFLVFARRKNSQLKLLLQEVQHRAKNNLQNVGALLTLFSRDIHDEQARQALEEGRRRVDAMKILEQKLLHQPQKPTLVNAGDYLSELIESLAAALPTKTPVNIEHHIQSIEMDVEKAMSIGLIVNELVLNAVKHAQIAPAIVVSLKKDGKFRLVVEDNGLGLPAGFNPEQSAAFGLKIVRLFADKLKASFHQTNTPGARFEFVFD